MRLKYDIKLAKPGELSGDLIVVGSALEQAVNTGKQAVIHSVMAREGMFVDGKEPSVSMENLRASVKNAYSSRLVRQEYGNPDSRLITPGFFFMDDGYDPAEFFKGADIVYVRKKPVIECRVALEEVDIQKPGDNYEVPDYMAKIFDMYERDFKRGKLSKRLMWHVPSKYDFVFYWRNTRKLERTRRKIRRNKKWGWAIAGLELKEDEIRRMFR